MACAKPTLAVGNELVVWPATLVVSMASENRAMLGRRTCQAAGLTGFGTRLLSRQAHTGQCWRSIGATKNTAAVARRCLATFGSDLLPSRSRTRFAAASLSRRPP